MFIDCRKAYSHSTSDNLWSLQWCHFYAPSLPAVYEKYKERGGRPVFHPDDIASFTSLLSDLYNLASSSDYIRDMRINEKLGTLLTLLMEQSWHPESVTVSRKRMELAAVKEYLDEHFTDLVYEHYTENNSIAPENTVAGKVAKEKEKELETWLRGLPRMDEMVEDYGIDIPLWEKIMDQQGSVCCAWEKTAFEEGMKVGIRLMMEVMK